MVLTSWGRTLAARQYCAESRLHLCQSVRSERPRFVGVHTGGGIWVAEVLLRNWVTKSRWAPSIRLLHRDDFTQKRLIRRTTARRRAVRDRLASTLCCDDERMSGQTPGRRTRRTDYAVRASVTYPPARPGRELPTSARRGRLNSRPLAAMDAVNYWSRTTPSSARSFSSVS